jgi:hypothetical protein
MDARCIYKKISPTNLPRVHWMLFIAIVYGSVPSPLLRRTANVAVYVQSVPGAEEKPVDWTPFVRTDGLPSASSSKCGRSLRARAAVVPLSSVTFRLYAPVRFNHCGQSSASVFEETHHCHSKKHCKGRKTQPWFCGKGPSCKKPLAFDANVHATPDNGEVY